MNLFQPSLQGEGKNDFQNLEMCPNGERLKFGILSRVDDKSQISIAEYYNSNVPGHTPSAFT
jgi:hypothetical protein